jgi:nuclear protein localization family protein 4
MGDLRRQITERLSVPLDRIVLTKDRASVKGRDSDTLAKLGVKHGDILNLDAEAEIPAVAVAVKLVVPEAPPATLKRADSSKTPEVEEQHLRRCQHGPGVRCINCIVLEEAKRKLEDNTPKKEDLSWMCSHPPSIKCVKCMKDNFVAGIKHQSFETFMAVKRARCQHKAEASCPNCLPPAETSYKLKLNCLKHPPYPAGVCNSCMPATAVLARQPYRHVDYVEFMNVKEVTSFVRHWESDLSCMQQRVGFLYGYYAEDPNYPDGVRAVVEAIYEPPQIGDTNGFSLLDDPYREVVDRIAASLSLERVGWLFTSINHDAYLTSHEIRMAAKFQQEHLTVHPSGYKVSKFVTVVVKPKEEGIAPEAYMVSDQAQALERDDIFGDSSHVRRLVKRPGKPSELLPTIMCENAPTEEFAPEWLIVNVGCGLPTRPQSLLNFYDFPVENRTSPVTQGDLKAYLKKHQNVPNPQKYGDFHLLVFLAQLIDPMTACVVAEAVGSQGHLEDYLDELIRNYGQ